MAWPGWRRPPATNGPRFAARRSIWPEISPTADEAAAAIVEEMFQSGPVEVGLARTQRRTLERMAEPLAAATGTPFQPGDAIVLSGGRAA